MAQSAENDKTYLEIEQDLRKRFRKNIWCRFTKAIRDYDLIQEGDKIADMIYRLKNIGLKNCQWNIQTCCILLYQLYIKTSRDQAVDPPTQEH